MSTSSQPSGMSGERPKRRTFTAEYKTRIVAEYDAAPDGTKASILRREALYSSHVVEWRKQVEAGTVASTTARRVEKARAKAASDAAEVARLRRENARLARELDKTREALVITGKAHALLGKLSESAR
jgi:transposase